uniref:VTT domain-containing protein n=1 Tax=Picea sitchensis TaxID=3332 RepID=D5ABF3_PICSI|nr:unknown [Picea sitchensis]
MTITRGSMFRLLLALLLLGAFATVCLTLPMQKTLKDFLVWIDKNLGHWGPLVLAVAYIPLTVLAVPASILTLGGGYLFGLTVGFIADSIGSTAGATAAFLVGKTIGRSYVVSKLKDYPQFQAVAIAVQRSGFKIVLLLRLVPLLPFNMLNYLLSVTPVSIGEYILASWIGMMPITFAFVYVGTTIKDLSDITHGWNQISTTRWILLSIGSVASVVLMVLVTKVARKSLNKALEENDSKLDCILVTPDLPVVNEPHLDLLHPLIIKVEPSANNHDH